MSLPLPAMTKSNPGPARRTSPVLLLCPPSWSSPDPPSIVSAASPPLSRFGAASPISVFAAEWLPSASSKSVVTSSGVTAAAPLRSTVTGCARGL